MDITLLLTFQLVADAVLCIAIVFLFAIVNREIKKRGSGINANALSEFNRLIVASQGATENLLQAMDESRKILKEISYAIDEKERRLRTLLEASEARVPAWKEEGRGDPGASADDRYEKALKMVEEGLTEREIAERLGLTEGEVGLIVGLNRRKNEPV